MNRPTVADLAKAAEVSVSTVERVLSGRQTVRRTTLEHILDTARDIGFHGIGSIRKQLTKDVPVKTFGFLLNNEDRVLYKTLSNEIALATSELSSLRVRCLIHHVESLDPESSARQLLELGMQSDVMAAVTIDHPKIHAAITDLKGQGKPVFSLLSDTTSRDRAGFIGANDWQIGRSAGWFAARLCPPSSKMAVLIGSHRYLCQQINEMSFRAYLREHADTAQFYETQVTGEDDMKAREVIEQMLIEVPDLDCVFVAGGGIDGVVQALKAAGPRNRAMCLISTELTDMTRSALTDGQISVILAHSVKDVASQTVAAMAMALTRSRPQVQHTVPFKVIISENTQ